MVLLGRVHADDDCVKEMGLELEIEVEMGMEHTKAPKRSESSHGHRRAHGHMAVSYGIGRLSFWTGRTIHDMVVAVQQRRR